jgi:hypothetical protein
MLDNDERMRILKMIEESKITAEEGARLLSAMEAGGGAPGGTAATHGPAKWLRIKVTEIASGQSKASVQIPIALVDAGLKIGAHFAPEVEGVDMSNVLKAVRSGVTGKIIDVTDEADGEHVEIFVE